MSPRLFLTLAAASLIISGCSAVEGLFAAPPSGLDVAPRGGQPTVVSVRVETESGDPLSTAALTLDSGEFLADGEGIVQVELRGPEAGVLRAEGYLDEPVVLAASDSSLTVAMWARVGSDGVERTAHHYGGDVMLGRRYLDPSRDDTPLVEPDDPDSARDVVSSIDDLFAAADLSVVNLETVVAADPGPPYPGKRFLLTSPPVVTAMLDQLGVDVVTLGNNHLNDWEDAGVVSTLHHLEGAGVEAVGAGLSADTATRGVIFETSDTKVGILSYTTVTGDFVNDSLPVGGTMPAGLPEAERWQYEERVFAFGSLVEPEPRVAGEAWVLFESLEGDLDTATVAELWTALRQVYPELQDWVARRGHGGAAHFSPSVVETGIDDLESRGADIVVVQLHAGFQFSESPSTFVRRAARASIDAGADLVIGHHPHVIQGFETYRGKPIAFSLGNFVFDQNFMSTFPTMFLRAVYAGDDLLEARVYPVLLDDYRPVPVAGSGARSIVDLVRDRSRGQHAAQRVHGSVLLVEGARELEDVAGVDLEMEGSSGVIRFGDGSALNPTEVDTRDLLMWGDFDDVAGDGRDAGGVVWDVSPDDVDKSIIAIGDAPSGEWVLSVRSGPREGDTTWARPVARVARADHHRFDAEGTPLDPPARYRFEAMVRAANGTPMVRFDVYHFDDTDPTAEPVSDLIRRVEIPVGSPIDQGWETVTLDLPHDLFVADGGREANSVMIYLGVVSDRGRQAEALFDDVQLVEVRERSG